MGVFVLRPESTTKRGPGLSVMGLLAVVFALLAGSSSALASGVPGGVDPRAGVVDVQASGSIMEALMFYAVAIGVVASALGCCFSKNIVRMAVWLFCALGAVAVLYFLLAATFVGAIQLIVYAGGTLILLIFGVMLTTKSPWARFGTTRLETIGAGLVCVVLFIALVQVFGRTQWEPALDPVTARVAVGDLPGVSVHAIGEVLLTKYLVPFEVAGVLLMVVMVGAAHLARQDKN
jgi:NADH:ubiquinone oxidoreductase subunit 6 (subunit J)